MRLLTHNFLQSNVKGTEKGYPLVIEPKKIIMEESPMDKELLANLLPKIDYMVLRGAVQQVAYLQGDLPELPTEPPLDLDDSFLAILHKVLMDTHLMEGNLVCPDTGRKFPVKDGIPNMILHEDEI
jgi:multifunctional methyltransferase subunit TRM112